MTITPYEFWYDRQMVRFLEQIVRAFSGFQYQTGSIGGQPGQTRLVPCRIASSDRMIANLQSNLSENTLLSVPLITVSQTGLRGRRADLQNPTFVDNLQVTEREVVQGTYGRQRGNSYNVDRIMPVPFTMDIEIDIWTSNLQQKYMLLEQILPVIYPQFEIQSSDNALDWTAVTVCLVEDDFAFSSRSVNIGTTSEIDVMTIRVTIPIWLSAPAKVKRLVRIEEVIANINEGEIDSTGILESGFRMQQIIVTPGDACVTVDGSTITLFGPEHAERMADGSLPNWQSLIDEYGLLVPTVSKIKLFTTNDIEGPYVTGSVQYGLAGNQLYWTIDAMTLPANTLPAVDAVIDPLRSFPTQGLPTVADGQRYLLLNDVGHSVAWGNLTAKSNDIIQYGSGSWSVVFDAAASTDSEYVLNSHTNRQLHWTGQMWIITIDGFYPAGHWQLLL